VVRAPAPLLRATDVFSPSCCAAGAAGLRSTALGIGGEVLSKLGPQQGLRLFCAFLQCSGKALAVQVGDGGRTAVGLLCESCRVFL